jgi:hypothetical protein
MAENELVYVPEYGFRLAAGGFQAAGPVSADGPGVTATVVRMLGSADQTEVAVEVLSASAQPIRPALAGTAAVRATLSAGAWSAEGRGYRSMRSDGRAWFNLTFPAVPGPADEVSLRLDGSLGAWELRIPVRPIGDAARRLDVTGGTSAAHLGVTLRVSGAILDPDLTLVRIDAAAEEPIRFVRGLGTDVGNRRPPGRELVLTDDRGGSYQELTEQAEQADPMGRSYIALFPPVDTAARGFHLEVRWVTVEELGDGVEVDVPVQPAVVDVGRYRLELLSSEAADGSNAAYYPLRVRFRWPDAGPPRRPVGPGQVFVNGRGAGFTAPWRNELDHLDVQVAEPPARRLRLAFPRVRLTGPWRIDFTR